MIQMVKTSNYGRYFKMIYAFDNYRGSQIINSNNAFNKHKYYNY